MYAVENNYCRIMRFWLSLINYHTRSNYLNIPNSLNNKFNFLCNSLNEHSNSLNNTFNFLCNSLNIQTFKFSHPF